MLSDEAICKIVSKSTTSTPQHNTYNPSSHSQPGSPLHPIPSTRTLAQSLLPPIQNHPCTQSITPHYKPDSPFINPVTPLSPDLSQPLHAQSQPLHSQSQPLHAQSQTHKPTPQPQRRTHPHPIPLPRTTRPHPITPHHAAPLHASAERHTHAQGCARGLDARLLNVVAGGSGVWSGLLMRRGGGLCVVVWGLARVGSVTFWGIPFGEMGG